MIQINQLKLPIEHTSQDLEKKIQKRLRIGSKNTFSYQILKRSIDARKKNQILYIYQIGVELQTLKEEQKIVRLVNDNNVTLTKLALYQYETVSGNYPVHPPVIIGCGPAGLYCAYALAKAGLSPVIIEQGDTAVVRKQKVEDFWLGKGLCPNSNVQFGEGGAGTFSDGKLNTLVKDSNGRNKEVLRLFVEAGAPSEIIYEQKPHLGTDQLISIITNIRHMIEELGGTFRFQTKLTGFEIENNSIKGIYLNEKELLSTDCVVLAIGHSARDTFFEIQRNNIEMVEKSFAVGVRIEHPQEMINLNQYGIKESTLLGAAPYKVTSKTSDGRGVYSFCMCPGGYVVNASSEPERIAVNGMSYADRGSHNANSAIVVTVSPDDYKCCRKPQVPDVLAGIEFQRTLEHHAYLAGNKNIPVQLLGDYLQQKNSTNYGDFLPCIKGKTSFADLNEVFPDYINRALGEGIQNMNRYIQGFSRYDAILSGVESRTSSPVRILRNEFFESSIQGIYPCGEGAGYAGGITSAAMDGLKVAEAIVKKI